jgi:hypothetical protein
MHSTEIAVGTSTVPLARMTPLSTDEKPNTTLLHSMMCSSPWASSTTGGLVTNAAIKYREKR